VPAESLDDSGSCSRRLYPPASAGGGEDRINGSVEKDVALVKDNETVGKTLCF
jgi:hypothetical protein